MKRLFPRVVPAALSLLGLLGFVSLNQGCTPQNNVKPGAPVLTALTIVENGSTNTSITAGAIACAMTVTGGGACFVADNVIEGVTVDKADVICQTTTSDWCRCMGDPTMSAMGTWDCDPFSPMSIVYATFDRLLDTKPLDPGDAAVQARDDIVALKATPAAPTAVTTSTSYTPMGDPTYFFFAGGPNLQGPSLTIQAMPAMPAGTTVTLSLDQTKVLAKDGKTPFMGGGLLVDGTLKFNTAAFGVTIGVPTAPPPDASADASADAATDGGADAANEAGSEAGTDGGVADASASEVSTEAGASDAGTTSDAAASETATSDAAEADAAPATPPTPGAPVPADMNTVPITLTFNNTVDGDMAKLHVTITENGLPFTAFAVDTSMAPKLTITPTTMWAAGKTYVVTVDATAADVVGDTLKTPASAAFVMAN